MSNSISKEEALLRAELGKDRQKRDASSRRRSSIPPHRHCSSCHVAIPLKSEPPVCDEDDCLESFNKQIKTQKQFRFWGTVIIVLFLIITIGPYFGIGT